MDKMNLDQLALKHGCDKSSKRHNYMIEYEKFFAPIKETTGAVLELGIYKGMSLRAWYEYFIYARVFGIDAWPICKNLENIGIQIFVGLQNDVAFLERVCAVTGELDIVIDDCSHKLIDQLTSFNFLWNKLKKGGIYAIEDVIEPNLPILLMSAKRVKFRTLSVYKSALGREILLILKKI